MKKRFKINYTKYHDNKKLTLEGFVDTQDDYEVTFTKIVGELDIGNLYDGFIGDSGYYDIQYAAIEAAGLKEQYDEYMENE